MLRLQNLLLLGVLSCIAIGQDYSMVSDVPSCGQVCFVTTPIDLGLVPPPKTSVCASTDFSCWCTAIDYEYDLGYCVSVACSDASPTEYFSALSSAVSVCSNGIVPGPTGSSADFTIRQLTLQSTSTPVPVRTPLNPPTTATSTSFDPSGSKIAIPALSTSGSTRFNSSGSATSRPKANSSAQIGLGIGVPLGVVVISIVIFLLFRYWKHKQGSRARHHGTIMAAGLYPANEEGGAVRIADDKAAVTHELKYVPKDNKEVHEIHGEEVPASFRELPGSPGVSRYELPTPRGSI